METFHQNYYPDDEDYAPSEATSRSSAGRSRGRRMERYLKGATEERRLRKSAEAGVTCLHCRRCIPYRSANMESKLFTKVAPAFAGTKDAVFHYFCPDSFEAQRRVAEIAVALIKHGEFDRAKVLADEWANEFPARSCWEKWQYQLERMRKLVDLVREAKRAGGLTSAMAQRVMTAQEDCSKFRLSRRKSLYLRHAFGRDVLYGGMTALEYVEALG